MSLNPADDPQIIAKQSRFFVTELKAIYQERLDYEKAEERKNPYNINRKRQGRIAKLRGFIRNLNIDLIRRDKKK